MFLAGGVQPKVSDGLKPCPTNTLASVAGGCAGALEPIRGCHRVGTPVTVVTQITWMHHKRTARERVSGTARTPAALAQVLA